MIVLAVIYGLITLLGFIGNLLVLLVVTIYRCFHCMRYFPLASLALSDFLFMILISNRGSHWPGEVDIWYSLVSRFGLHS